MVNITPALGRNGSIMIGAVEIGYVKGVTFEIDSVPIKDYKFGSDLPAVLEGGNKSYKFTFEKMYIDATYATAVINDTKLTIVLGPASSTPSGQPKYTLGGAIISKESWKNDQGGIVMEHAEGEALTLLIGTY
jgi:hypothetical protein